MLGSALSRRRFARTCLAAALGASLGRIGDAAAPVVRLPEGLGAWPVRGLHLAAPPKREFGSLEEFARGVLAARGVNTLVVEFDYQFDFRSRPEFSNPSAPNHDDARRLARICRQNGIELIPQLNCLGHQSWDGHNGRLLEAHPEFDETRGKYPGNSGIYCRSYCPLHPGVHAVLFDLIDDLAAACDAKAVHVGMDEVHILADPDCPRCAGKNPADLFAGEVAALDDHLRGAGRKMWMWGDRFIDGRATGLGKWEASENGVQSAIGRVPKDIVICDWHYDRAPDTPRYFIERGFDVVSCPWRKTAVALGELKILQAIRHGADAHRARRALGMLQTTWCGFGAFEKAYRAQQAGAAVEKNSASESAHCFDLLFAAL